MEMAAARMLILLGPMELESGEILIPILIPILTLAPILMPMDLIQQHAPELIAWAILVDSGALKCLQMVDSADSCHHI